MQGRKRNGRLTRPSYRRQASEAATRAEPQGGQPDVSLYVQEAVTRKMVEDVVDEVRDLRDRLTTLLFVVTGSVLVDIFTRLRGG